MQSIWIITALNQAIQKTFSKLTMRLLSFLSETDETTLQFIKTKTFPACSEYFGSNAAKKINKLTYTQTRDHGT